MRPKTKADKHAGEGRLKSTVGLHTRNPGWKPGRHWVVCQRCGLDYYDNEIKREWTGAIVCKSCWEPRHPQDFVRGRRDRISAPMPINPDSLINQTAAEGSTDAPATTFPETPPTASTMPNQSDSTGDTITTVSSSSYFGASYSDQVDTYTIDHYELGSGAFPSGISIDPLTGDIDGTIDAGEEASSPFSIKITAVYTSGYRVSSNLWTWTVDVGTQPPTNWLANLVAWWDLSESDGNYCFADTTAETGVSSESFIDRVNDRRVAAPGGDPNGQSSAESFSAIWDSNVQNGIGAADFSHATGNAARMLQNSNIDAEGPTADQPVTIIVVAQVPAVDATNVNALFGGSNTNGHQLFMLADEDGGVMRVESIAFGSYTDTEDIPGTGMASHTGEWFCFWLEVQSGNMELYLNNDLPSTPLSTLGHDPSTLTISGYNIGTAYQGAGPIVHQGWSSYIGESVILDTILSADERTLLYGYFRDKWALTAEI